MWLYLCSADLCQVCFLVAQLCSGYTVQPDDITGARAFKSECCRIVHTRSSRDDGIADNPVAIGRAKELKGIVVYPFGPTVDGIKTDLARRSVTAHNGVIDGIKHVSGDDNALAIRDRNTNAFPVTDELTVSDRSRAVDKLDAPVVRVEVAAIKGNLSSAEVSTIDTSGTLVGHIVADEDIPGRNIRAAAVNLDSIAGARALAIINKDVSDVIAVVNDELRTIAR